MSWVVGSAQETIYHLHFNMPSICEKCRFGSIDPGETIDRKEAERAELGQKERKVGEERS